MGFWPRKTVAERDAVAAFVEQTMRSNAERWTAVAPLLRQILKEKEEERPGFFDEPSTAFQFALARMAFDLDALPVLLAPDQAKRIRNTVQAMLHPDPVLGPQCDRFFSALAVSAKEVRGNEFLTHLYGSHSFAIYGVTLFDLLELRDYVERDNPIRSPTDISTLVSTMAELGVGWWQSFLKRYRLAAT